MKEIKRFPIAEAKIQRMKDLCRRQMIEMVNSKKIYQNCIFWNRYEYYSSLFIRLCDECIDICDITLADLTSNIKERENLPLNRI